MAGTGGFAVSRSHGGDRFYNPRAMRAHQKFLLEQQQKQQPQRPAAAAAAVEAENRTESDDSATTLSKAATNLDHLIESVTPCVPARYCSEVNGRGWRIREAGLRPFYCLGDLWESFKESSAYGAGVPLLLKGTDSIVQYFVPFLSGIQIYIDPTNPPKMRRPVLQNEVKSLRETSSGGSNYFEADKRSKNLVNSNSQRLNNVSLRDKSPLTSSGNEGEVSNSSGLLVFEYLEQEQPYLRKPFTDKITILESQFPELSLYRSCDLMPASWISIAWYPIYRIPMGSTLKDLDASFLTIHPLSTCSANSGQPQYPSANSGQKVSRASTKISVPVIGLASYKYKGSILTPSGPQECEQENELLQAASNWLQSLQVVLPDFQFFRSHYSPWR